MPRSLPLIFAAALAALSLGARNGSVPEAPRVEYEQPTHVYITYEAYQALPAGPMRDEIASYIGSRNGQSCAGSDAQDANGTTITEGAFEEDCYPLSLKHFWDPDSNAGLAGNTSAYTRGTTLYKEAVNLYKAGSKAAAYYKLGHVAHLLEDMAQPAHVHLDAHGLHNYLEGDDDEYESLIEARKDKYTWSAPPSIGDATANQRILDFLRYRESGSAYPLQPIPYVALPANVFNSGERVYTDTSGVAKLFLNMAETSDFFESEDHAGDIDNIHYDVDPAGLIPNEWHSLGQAAPATNPEPTLDEALRHANYLVPLAIRYVAGLYAAFWDETHPPAISSVSVDPTLGCLGFSSRQWVTISGSNFVAYSKVFLDDTGDATGPFEIGADRMQFFSTSQLRVCAGVSYATNWTALVRNAEFDSNLKPFTVSAPTASVSLSAAPATISSGSASTLTWSSTGMTSCTASGGWSGAKGTSGTATVSPLSTTTYTLTCSGVGATKAASATVTVTGGGTAAPTLGLSITPSTVTSGSPVYLGWASSNATQCTASGGWSGNRALSSSETNYPTSTTTYSMTCSGPGGQVTKSVTATIGSSPPGVELRAAPTSIVAGEPSVLTWSSSGVSDCNASGAWLGSRATTGSETVYPSNSSTYTLQCNGNATQQELIRNGTFTPTVSEWTRVDRFFADDRFTNCRTGGCPGYAYLAEPNGTLQNSNSLYGAIWQEIDLPANATQIALSYWMSISTLEPTTTPNDGFYVVVKDTSGNYLEVLHGYSNANASGWVSRSATLTQWKGRRVRIEFWGSTNATYGSVFRIDDVSVIATVPQQSSSSVTVDVRQPDPPSVALSTNPTSVNRGQSSTLTWSVSGATSCTASDGWSGSRSFTGTENVSPSNTTSYTLTCSGAGGTRSSTTTIDVIPPPPVVTLSASQTTINVGQSTTLTWSASDATSCTAYGTWQNEGAKPSSGSQSVSPIRSASYTLSCSGRGGTGNATAAITVVQPALAPPGDLRAAVADGVAVRVAWTGSSWTDHYEVERATNAAGPFTLIGLTTGTEFVDVGTSFGVAYLYRVRAIGYEGASSPYSNRDFAVAMVFTNDPLVVGTMPVRSGHLRELQQAANALRSCANLGATSFAGGTAGTVVRAAHLVEIRSAIDAARTAMGFAASGASVVSAGGVIRVVHIDELRAAVR
jgi:hypothetical protein